MIDEPSVQWKPIIGFEEYLISEDGVVFSTFRNIIIKQYLNDGGTPCVAIRSNGKVVRKRICILVAATFIDNPNQYYLLKLTKARGRG